MPSNPPTPAPLDVFISYSHKDEDLKEELEVHLSNLVRQNKIKPWQDRSLEAGTKWDPQIKAALAAARIILLLVTPRFMASNYINDVELTQALARDQAGTAQGDSDYSEACRYHRVPRSLNSKPYPKTQSLSLAGKTKTKPF
jgi:hypothetical protein